MDRTGPFLRQTHDQALSWLNQLLIELLHWIEVRGEQPIISPELYSGWETYRAELEGCITPEIHINVRAWEDLPTPLHLPGSIHSEAIKEIDALIADLTAIWEKREPTRRINKFRITILEQAYIQIGQCRYDPRKY